MTTTQVPIIAWEKRYMTTRECARLQSMDCLKYLPETETRAFRALGNAVNSQMVEVIAKQLIGRVAPQPVRSTVPTHPASRQRKPQFA
jgi:DNA (cytosine-5)-methyltransferase 1